MYKRQRFKEVRLDEFLDVVHRHGLGSCSGRLVATAQGVRYATENAKDRFDVPLAAVERAEIDYVAKTLKLRLRGGRAYNFTREDGSADALLVFQQRLAKARERLTQAP